MTEANVRDTKDRILDSAERLFAVQGIDATSLRQITTEAEANLAAVNYHFQSKEELIRSVFIRRIRPMNAQRLESLDCLESEYPNGAPLDSLLHSFYKPILDVATELRPGGITISQIMGRIFTQPNSVFDRILEVEMAETFNRFSSAFARSLPHLTHGEILWRMIFTVGVIAHTVGSEQKMTRISGGLCNMQDKDEMLRQMVRFSRNGLLAPSTEGPQ